MSWWKNLKNHWKERRKFWDNYRLKNVREKLDQNAYYEYKEMGFIKFLALLSLEVTLIIVVFLTIYQEEVSLFLRWYFGR